MGDRGISTALGYMLSLAIVTLLLVGMFTAGTAVVEDQREQVIRSELRVLGNRVAADITTIDRLAISDPDADVHLTETLPTSIAGRSYRVNVSPDSETSAIALTLSTDNPAVSVTITVNNGTPVAESIVSGGTLFVRYDGTRVVVDRA